MAFMNISGSTNTGVVLVRLRETITHVCLSLWRCDYQKFDVSNNARQRHMCIVSCVSSVLYEVTVRIRA